MGRGIVPDDARPGAPPVFVMAYKMWVRPVQPRPVDPGQELYV